MKRIMISFLTGLAFLPLAALDFDFTANPPAARGKVPMLKLDDSLKIGGTHERTALNFNGKSQIQVPESSHLSLKNGLTVALELDSRDKADGKDRQMIILKHNEWLFYRSGNHVDFMWKSDKKWIPVYRMNMTFEKKHKIVFTLDRDREFNFWLDGQHIQTVRSDSLPEPNPAGKGLIMLGGGWNNWGFKGDIYRIKILDQVWNKEQIQEFFK